MTSTAGAAGSRPGSTAVMFWVEAAAILDRSEPHDRAACPRRTSGTMPSASSRSKMWRRTASPAADPVGCAAAPTTFTSAIARSAEKRCEGATTVAGFGVRTVIAASARPQTSTSGKLHTFTGRRRAVRADARERQSARL